MKQRIYLKHRKRISKNKILLCSILGLVVVTIFLLSHISNKIWPVLVSYAKTDAENIIVEIMNQAVQKKIPEVLDINELFVTNKDENGMITMIDFNPVTINQILAIANETIQKNLQAVENADVDYLKQSEIVLENALFENIGTGRISLIPMGVITNNVILANLGPTIPVKIHFIGNVTSNVHSKMSNYGINNVLLESFIQVTVKAELILPISIESIIVETEIPISIKMIQGKVPNYYQNGYNNNSSLLSIPIEE